MDLEFVADENPFPGKGQSPLDAVHRVLGEHADWRRDLIEHSNDLLCLHDLQGRLLSVNPAPARVLGYSVEELLQIPMRQLIAPEFRPQFDAYLEQVKQTGESKGFMTVVTRSEERRVWQYHNTLRTAGVAIPVVRGMAHDVTELIQAQRLLRDANQQLREEADQRERAKASLQLFRNLLDQSNDGIQLVEPQTMRFLDVNQAACAALGYSREEMLQKTVYEVDPLLDEALDARVREALEKQGFLKMETVHRRKDGSTFPVEVSIKRVVLEREYFVTTVRDISQRKQVQAALEASESHFRMLVEQTSDGIFLADAEGRYLDVNSAGAAMLGYRKDEVVGLKISDIVAPREVERIPFEVSRYANGRVTVVEWEIRRKDGSRFPGEVTGRRLPDGRLQGILRDISERKRSEETLRSTLHELRLAKEKLAEEKLYLQGEIDSELGFGEIIGQSRALKEILAQVTTVAGSDATVLVLGETGTGKELIARAIHRMSTRAANSFIKMNCAAIPSGLLESELFGHEKGAFTGAIERKVGRLELADRGSLFLDEVGEIPLLLQPKLLRVLQDQEFERLGSTRTLQVNFRLIVATNRNLQESVKQGEFRSDLYYRLRVFPIRVPALRERRDDIPLLVEHFVRKYAGRMNKRIDSVPKKTIARLMEWEWPGNIRELENFIERSVILTVGSVLNAPLSELSYLAPGNPQVSLEEAQREHILRVLREAGGKVGGPMGAAARLGMRRTTLQSKLKRLGIEYRKEKG